MKTIIAIAIGATLAFAGAASGADIGSLAWNQSNIATLRSLDKADLLAFFNEQRRKVGIPNPLTAAEIGEFEWADLAGNGHYQLVLTLSGPCAHSVAIENRDASGNVSTTQTITGFADLKTAVRDLKGDSKDELILQKPLLEHDCGDVVTWPVVYRLENGKYVEASRDFPDFYDNQVLPKLDAEISQYEAKGEQGNSRGLSGLIIERDKVLRMLGRNPTAGLQQAYQWMSTDDPYLLLDAAETFKDIGGHQREANAATASYTRARCERDPGLAMCKNAALR
jgi:hypothetical protein